MTDTRLVQNGTARADNPPLPESVPDRFAEVGLSKLISAFEGRKFRVRKLRSVARAMNNVETTGEEWELLKMTSGTHFDKMSRKALQDLGATAVAFLEMEAYPVWRALPPSRARWALAAKAGVDRWATGVEANVLRAGAFLLEEVWLGNRNDPDGAKALAEAVKAKEQSIAVYPNKKDGFKRQFVLSERPGPPADPE